MTKTYEIDGRRVTLKANAHAWIRYKAEFGSELPEDIEKAIATDEMRQQAKNGVERGRLLGEEYRLYLQILWVLICEGTSGTPCFEEWASGVSGLDLPGAVQIVTELFISTMRPDKKYRVGQGKGDGSRLTAEELIEMIYATGADSMALGDLTVGMAINLVHAHINSIRRARGEQVPDPEKQIKIFRGIIADVDSGAIPPEAIENEELERMRRAVKEWDEA